MASSVELKARSLKLGMIRYARLPGMPWRATTIPICQTSLIPFFETSDHISPLNLGGGGRWLGATGRANEMPVDLSLYFDQFIRSITLGEPQVSRMNSAANTINHYLSQAYGVPLGSITMQGSYANGTAVEPVDGGEYDVDLICECVDGATSANDALNQLQAIFEQDGRFRDRVKPRKPCVRLEYAPDDVGKFHVDVVPARSSGQEIPSLEAPRRDEGWKGTTPQEYTEWCRQQGAAYARTVKAMKRWRDDQQTVRQAIKSIVLQVLVSGSMPIELHDAERLAGTLRNLHDQLENLEDPPFVANPVWPEENLAKNWTKESFRDFVSELAEAVAYADRAVNATDTVEAADAWRAILGEDFPVLSPDELGIQLADYSHAQEPAAKGWSEQLDLRYGVSIEATQQRGQRGTNRKPYPHNGPIVFAGHKLHFKAQLRGPNHGEVWWQVANTGAHARDKNGLRGEIFRGRKLNGNPTEDRSENWESTSYTGAHLIRALLVRNGNVVARSDWFRVNIYSRGGYVRPSR